MANGSLLSFLAQRLPQREVVASDGLAFLLQRSQAARSAVARFLGIEREDFDIEGQFVSDEARPDIALLDPATRKPMGLIELKFWAALTDAQPLEYINKLEAAGGGPLCFVAPPERHVALWKELLDRAPGFVVRPGLRRVATRGQLTLQLVSWDELLAPMASVVGGSPIHADLEQLRGLIREFEAAEFRPFYLEDLGNLDAPRLAMALADLADGIVKQGEADGTLSIGRLKATADRYSTGRYFILGKRVGAWLGLNHLHWAQFGTSPLWLEFRGGGWAGYRHLVRNALPERFGGTAPTAFEAENGNYVFSVPVAVQVERAVAIRHGAKWLAEFAQRLVDAGVPLSDGNPLHEAEQA